jgi:hypothetical protein
MLMGEEMKHVLQHHLWLRPALTRRISIGHCSTPRHNLAAQPCSHQQATSKCCDMAIQRWQSLRAVHGFLVLHRQDSEVSAAGRRICDAAMRTSSK